MGRKAIYGTYKKYAPYIKIIMDDLGITDKVELDFVFGTWQKKGGDAKLYSDKPHKYDGKYHGRVRVDKHGSHWWILEALMHELKHIQQYVTGRLSVNVTWKYETTKRGKVNEIPYRKWDGVLTRHFQLKSDAKGDANPEYLMLPWEIDARDYEQKKNRLRLFPNDALPVVQTKILVGVVGKTKFYKIDT